MKGKKTGGRQKGTPNKATVMNKQIINDLLADYSASGLMCEDFQQLEAKDRMAIAERLMQYVMPKMQSVTADMNVSSDKLSLEHTLVQLSKDPHDNTV
jgi:arginyl-tRNA synthetase